MLRCQAGSTGELDLTHALVVKPLGECLTGVNDFGWLSPDQMVTGLGVAESTPGPLIMVTEYVGFLAAWNNPGGLPPITAATVGALVTTYVTFLPCFFLYCSRVLLLLFLI